MRERLCSEKANNLIFRNGNFEMSHIDLIIVSAESEEDHRLMEQLRDNTVPSTLPTSNILRYVVPWSNKGSLYFNYVIIVKYCNRCRAGTISQNPLQCISHKYVSEQFIK